MRVSTPSSDRTELDQYLKYGVLASIVVHILFLLLFMQRTGVPKSAELFIDLVPEIPQAPEAQPNRSHPQQIVSEPDSPITQKDNQLARLLAEKAHETSKEQIKRGDSPEAGPQPNLKSEPSSSQPSSTEQKTSKPKAEKPEKTGKTDKAHAINQDLAPLKTLRLDSKTLLKDFGQAQASPLPEGMQSSPSSYRAFTRPPGSGAAFLGRSGLADFIPSLPDGDITLLNTKADQFAVFVRRVATQVFGQLRAAGWEKLRPADINAISRPTTIKAVLSTSGQLLKVLVLESSGSDLFDATVLSAAKKGATDPNPPFGAKADDGNINFIFQSRSWVRYAPAARNGAPTERRWLMLATGLE